MATTTATAAARRPVLRLLRLRNVPIHKQLQIEEAIFRVDKQSNWFICNQDAEPTTIVMGISGKPELLVHIDACKRYDHVSSSLSIS